MCYLVGECKSNRGMTVHIRRRNGETDIVYYIYISIQLRRLYTKSLGIARGSLRSVDAAAVWAIPRKT